MSDAARSGFIKANRYQILKTLGQGGFGLTYLAHDVLLNRKVVIKEMFLQGSVRTTDGIEFPSQLTRGEYRQYIHSFVSEARALAKFNSPHVVRVQDVFEWEDTAFLVMDYLEGQTLMGHLQQHGKLPPAEALRMARQLAQALEVVHQAGLLHRDIKPDNIFLTSAGTPVLIDFGAAREFQPGGNAQMSVILTHGFAPIEQYSHSGKFGPYTDLYALAATLLFAVTAKMPPLSVERLQEDLPLPEIPAQYAPGFRRAIVRGLGVRPTDRPANAQEFLALLDGGRDDFGAWELAGQIQAQGQHQAVRSRLIAQALLVVFSRQQRELPTVHHIDELKYALERSLALLSVWQEGLKLIYGDAEDVPALLATDLQVAVNGLTTPQALTDFMAGLSQAAALPAAAQLASPPTTQWQAPAQKSASVHHTPIQAKFAEFRLLKLSDRPIRDIGFLSPTQGVYALSAAGELSVYHGVTGDVIGTRPNVLAVAGNKEGLWSAEPGLLQQVSFQAKVLNAAYPFPDHAVSLAVGPGVVAAAGQQGTLQVSQGGSSQVIHWTEQEASPPQELQFSPDSRALLVRDEHKVSALDPKTLRLLRSFSLGAHAVTAFALSSDSQRVATAHGNQIVLWDFQSGRVVQRLVSPGTDTTHSLFFNPAGSILGVLSDALYLISSSTGKVIAAHQAGGGRLVKARISSSGRMIALGGIHHAELLHLSRLTYQALPDLNSEPKTAPLTPPSSAPRSPQSHAPLSEIVDRPEPTPPPSSPSTFGSSFMSLKGLPLPHAQAKATAAEPRKASDSVRTASTQPMVTPPLQGAPVLPYQECRLPSQADFNLTGRPLRQIADLLLEVVQVEGPVARQEAYRRVVNAHGLSKVGSRIAQYLDAAVELLEAGGQAVVRGDFLWPSLMSAAQPPVRNRQALTTRAVDLVCDEELLAAARIVQAQHAELGGAELAAAVNRLLGFSRLTLSAAQRIQQLLDRPYLQADAAPMETL